MIRGATAELGVGQLIPGVEERRAVVWVNGRLGKESP